MAANPLFHRGHYNILAKQFREQFERYVPSTDLLIGPLTSVAARTAITDLALATAERLQEDNPAFEPLMWLDACSTENYPISELWEDYIND